MKIVAVGAEAKGIIAVGQFATGIVAFGQAATGMIAIGQLARGVVAVGQVALGVVAFGQGAVALGYGGGMVGIAGFNSPLRMLFVGVLGETHLRHHRRWQPGVRWHRRWTAGYVALRVLTMLVIAALVWFVGLAWLLDFFDTEVVIRVPVPPSPAPPGSR